MKFLYFSVTFMLLTYQTQAGCNLNSPNDVLSLIKKKHPIININNSKKQALDGLIASADQIPNPELDLETVKGNTPDGDVLTTKITLKHNFELGSKRKNRTLVAEKSVLAGGFLINSENEKLLIDAVLKLYRLRQIHELIPLYAESLDAFEKILKKLQSRKSLSPEKQVELATLELVTSDYMLKLSNLNSEKLSLNDHLSLFVGIGCVITKDALPYELNIDEDYSKMFRQNTSSEISYAKTSLELAQAKLELEDANAYPNLEIGPTFEYEKMDASSNKAIGIALTMDIPIFHTNGGARTKALKEISVASLKLKNAKDEGVIDYASWVNKYTRFKKSLKSIPSNKILEKKHQKIESLFKRGIISTSLVIESHRQLIEFANTRFEFEQGVIEAQWNIYKMNGTTLIKKL